MLKGKKLTIAGPAGGHHSISKVTREVALACHRLGYPTDLWNTGLPTDWAEPRYKATVRDLLVPRAGQNVFALDEYLGVGVKPQVGWIAKLPGQKARGFLYDKFEFDDNWLRAMEHYLFVATPSKHAAAWLLAHGADPAKVVHAPLGVNRLDYYPVEPTPSVLKKFRWITPGHIGSETLVLWHNGSLQPRKGTAELLDAYREAFTGHYRRHDDRRPDVVLLVQSSATDWSKGYGRSLMDKIKDGPAIAWCDADLTVAEQRQVYALASVSVLPNYAEGFGLCALESLACGVPVVMPTHTGNADTFDESVCWSLDDYVTEKHNGRQLCDWHRPSVPEIAETLKYLHGEGRDEIAEKAEFAVEVAAQHPWSIGAARLCEAFELEQDLPVADGCVTVATLARNNAPMTADHALATVAASVGQKFKHVLVDNGSTEAAAMQAAAQKYGVTYLRHDNPDDLGVVATNLVWADCRTEFCARIDNDVKVKPDLLLRCVEHLRAHPECGAVGTLGYYPDGVLWAAGSSAALDLPGCGKAATSDVFVDKPVWGVAFSAVVLRTKAMLDIGGIGKEYVPCWCDDSDCCLALWLAGWEVHHIASTSHINERSATCGTAALRVHHEAKRKILQGYFQWMLDGNEPRVSNRVGRALRP